MFAAGGGRDAGPLDTRTTTGLTTFTALMGRIGPTTAAMRITDYDFNDVRRLLHPTAVLDLTPHRVNSVNLLESASLLIFPRRA